MNNFLNFLRIWVLLAGLLGVQTLWAQQPVRHIVLMQNSGWMLPFYEDPQDRFRTAVADLAQRLHPYSTELVLASFNQTEGSNLSPLLHYRGLDTAALRQAAAAVQLARRPGSRALADTDFREALVGAIQQFTPGEPAVVWIVTNNRNSPDNSPDTLRKNREFYLFLQNTAEIKRIVALPLPLPVVSRSRPNYRANGLMIYGLAYGAAADALLQRLLDGQRVFGQAPLARLKPLNAQALTFVPTAVEPPEARARLASDGKTLVLELAAAQRPSSVRVQGHFRNDFYPFDIQSANLALELHGFEHQGQKRLSAAVSVDRISALAVGAASAPVLVDLQIPPMPSMFALQVLLGREHQLPGVLRFELSQQQLVLAPDFVRTMNELFPGDPLPDLFVPGEQARLSVTDQPVVIQVTYPSWPLLLLLGAVLFVLLLLAVVFWLLQKSRKYSVSIDGHPFECRLKPFGSAVLRNAQGETIGRLRRRPLQPAAELEPKYKHIQVTIR